MQPCCKENYTSIEVIKVTLHLCPLGNYCYFTGNFIHDLCYESTDGGAFYSGQSWIRGGNIIANNVFSNIKTTEKVYLGSPSVQAIYLDDQVGGEVGGAL